MQTGEKIALQRKRLGLSQEDLALELKLSRQAVSRWETNEATPGTEKIIQLSRLFQVSIDYLLLEEQETPDMETVRSATSQPEGDTQRRSKMRQRRITFGGWLCAASLFPFMISIGAATGWMLRHNWYYADKGAFLTGVIESGKTIPSSKARPKRDCYWCHICPRSQILFRQNLGTRADMAPVTIGMIDSSNGLIPGADTRGWLFRLLEDAHMDSGLFSFTELDPRN